MHLEVGTKIRDYEILGLIGEGGMGEVYQARDVLLDRRVALKKLNESLTHDKHFSERFIKEARIQAMLTHPSIVGLLAFFEEHGIYYMVMEYAEGETLRDMIAQRGPIPEDKALQIFGRVADAMAYAHGKGVIHRDIKSSNIMIDKDYNVKVMDFGISHMLGDAHMTATGTRMGTLHYMSPEQVLALPDIDRRTDIYSLGIVLYEMLSGKLPFPSDTNSDFIIQRYIVDHEVPDPRQIYQYISDDTVSLLKAMTVKDRNARLSTLDDWKGLSTRKPEAAKPIPVAKPAEPIKTHTPKANPPKVSSTKVRKSPPWIAFAVVLIIIVAVLAYLFWPQKKELSVSDGQNLVLVEGGEFQMGSYNGDPDETPVHPVKVPSFYMGQYEVTQAEWNSVMPSNPSQFRGNNLPVDNVSWYDAIEYCIRRSEAEGLTPCYSIDRNAIDPNNNRTDGGPRWLVQVNWDANGYRLPTEAEWEYAARGGKHQSGYEYAGSNYLDDVSWHIGNSGGRSHNVGQKQANELGIYDMSGNVREWCWDTYSKQTYSLSPFNFPVGAVKGSTRILRGGSWSNKSDFSRVAYRNHSDPEMRKSSFGLRVVRNY